MKNWSKRNKAVFTVLGIFVMSLGACKKEATDSESEVNKRVQFELLDSTQTGIDFKNMLAGTDDFNVYKYRNFYNGGGVAIGDINNDGLADVYLTSNMNENKLYLNKGNFKFEDITTSAKVGGSRAWSTGVTMVDINADGFLDIYVCNSGDVKGDNKQNEFFINNGDLTFSESAADLGLDDRGFSTHASFFDYDKDGDLDVYLLNNSYQAIGSFNLTKNERPKRDVLGGDKLFENVDGVFEDVSEKANIFGSVIGFGLGVTVSDVNNDSWEDIYVSNDFFERDYLYINQKDGTFKETLTSAINSVSGASMGADAADINNDGYNDIFVTEMLPSDYERLKTVTTFEDWNKYQYNLKNDYYHQFTRNMLQLNNGDTTFSEIGRFSGVEASDWSWGALFFDMDNDGLKDLFIANGIYKDLTNQDYLRYISNREVMESIISNNQVDYKRLIDIIPSNKVENHAYRNLGGLQFDRVENGLQTEGFSNGAAYGDLDNDGDLDLIVNNVNMPLFVYRNNLDDGFGFLKVKLVGEDKNRDAIGAKLKLSTAHDTLYLEQQPARGFQSSMDNRPNFGFVKSGEVELEITWPNGSVSQLADIQPNQMIEVQQSTASKNNSAITSGSNNVIFKRLDDLIDFKHVENNYVDFNVDRLLPMMRSAEGPKIAVGDVNGDHKADLFIGGSKGYSPQLILAENDKYIAASNQVFDLDKIKENAESALFDADGDGDLDLYVCSGGIEFSKFSPNYYDSFYFNDGRGNFTRSDQSLPTSKGFHSSSTVCYADIDNDGDLDLFVGERAIANSYGAAGSGYLLINDGNGRFQESSEKFAPQFADLGMITDALFSDVNQDGVKDLIVVGEFMGIELFINKKGRFEKSNTKELSNLKGWWNTIEKADLDSDGDDDFIIGNHGLNSRFRATDARPITLYVSDYDGNGYLDPILTFRSDDGKDYPFELRHNLIDQLKYLSKKFPDYESFKSASITEIFTESQISNSAKSQVNFMKSIILINEGGLKFKVVELPLECQLTPIYAIETGDFDHDGDLDIVTGGNLSGVKPEFGRYDASYGNFIENLGAHKFKNKADSGLKIEGQIRDIIAIDNHLIFSRNNDTIVVYEF